MCNGEDHGLLDLSMIPRCNIVTNSALAAASLAGGRGRAFARIGWPVVSMTCCTACFGMAMLNFGTVISGNCARRRESLGLSSAATKASPISFGGCFARCSGVDKKSVGRTRRRLRRSTSSELWVRKSAPRRARLTEAMRKVHS